MLRALVVDNDPEFRVKIRQILDDMGYQADLLENGSLALDLASKTGYDLAVLDYMLPDLNGFQLGSLLRKKIPELSILILTEFDAWALFLEHSKSNPEIPYLAKPFGDDNFMQKINEITGVKNET